MAGSTITVKNLGGGNVEKDVYESILDAAENYPGWRIRVLGSDGNDNLEVLVENPAGLTSATRLTLPANQTVQGVTQVVIDQIAAIESAG
jgi:hypothetical protein